MAYFFGDFVQVGAFAVITGVPSGVGENAFLYGTAVCLYPVRLQALQLIFIPK